MNDRELAAARRRIALQHHPDRGGDVDDFVRVMQALEERTGASGRAPAVDVVRTVRGRSRRVRTAAGDLTTTLRGSLPRRVPGARRYAQL